MKILCVGYRDWAIRIYKNLSKAKKNKIYYHFKKKFKKKDIKN